MNHWITNESGEPQRMNDPIAWARWYASADRIIAKTSTQNGDVSTMFLGIDHQWGDGLPLLYETMIFGGPEDGYQDRYTTRNEAVAGHAVAVALITKDAP